MTRIFGSYAYGPGPRSGCWWDETIAAPDWPLLDGDIRADVGIVGGGFTGLSAALHLAEAGVSVALLEGQTPGWGASGRNGGFCCLGGSKLSSEEIDARFGAQAGPEFERAEVESVDLVASLLDRLGIDADRHSQGETVLAHNPKAMERLRRRADTPGARLTEARDLPAEGLNGPFHGALTTPVGFGLNPRKYLFGLARGAAAAGAQLFQGSPVDSVQSDGPDHLLRTARGQVRCRKVLICTNGYSSETLPPFLAGRYIPAQSNVLVTRPLSDAELAAQGWTSDQMAYDTRNLLHYFRLMPDRRFLFGMRGGLTSSPAAEARARTATRRHFERMFPAWAHVESPNTWSGMVCLARNLVPHVGPVPDRPGLFVGLAYHGNGVAMGSYSGKLLAGLVQGRNAVPKAMQAPMAPFPLGRLRRLVMPLAYLRYGLADL